MRHRNNVRQLGRTHSHRRAMYSNMATSFFLKERIITTKQKGRELKRILEKLITRAKHNLLIPSMEESKKLHNKREVMKIIKDRDVVKKLFENIAPRFKDRKGGYTRLYLLGKRRAGDAAELAIVELVEREKVEKKAPEEKETKKGKKPAVDKAAVKGKKAAEAKETKKDKKAVEAKESKKDKKAAEEKESKKDKKKKEKDKKK